MVGQLPNGLGPPAGFAAQDNAAVWVSLEQGLEAQRRPQHGLGAGETSAPAEVHQVIHREKVGNPVPEGEEGAGGVSRHIPLSRRSKARRTSSPCPREEERESTIWSFLPGKFLPQLFRRHAGGLIGGTEAGGGAEKEQVQAGTEQGL